MVTIALIGYRGAGKTTVGKWLGEQLDERFTDTDDAVLADLGYESVIAAWDDLGEPRWRETEARIIPGILRSGGIVALGGGAPLLPDVQKALETVPTIIHLIASPKMTTDRIDAGRDRPSLDATDLETRVARLPIYARLATHEVDTSVEMDDVKSMILAITKKAHLK